MQKESQHLRDMQAAWIRQTQDNMYFSNRQKRNAMKIERVYYRIFQSDHETKKPVLYVQFCTLEEVDGTMLTGYQFKLRESKEKPGNFIPCDFYFPSDLEFAAHAMRIIELEFTITGHVNINSLRKGMANAYQFDLSETNHSIITLRDAIVMNDDVAMFNMAHHKKLLHDVWDNFNRE